MPCYFFHLHNDLQTRDEEGRELASFDAARRAAEEDARHMAAESVRAGHLQLDHFVEVTAEDGQPLFRVTFGDVVRVG